MNLSENIKIVSPKEIETPEVDTNEKELGDNSIIFGEPVGAEKKLEDKKELDEKIASLLESIKKEIK